MGCTKDTTNQLSSIGEVHFVTNSGLCLERRSNCQSFCVNQRISRVADCKRVLVYTFNQFCIECFNKDAIAFCQIGIIEVELCFGRRCSETDAVRSCLQHECATIEVRTAFSHKRAA